MTVHPNTIRPGDWVRFYSSGRLVIGVVQYPAYRAGCSDYIDTDAGAVSVESIREIRKTDQGAERTEET